ncbi:MAG: alpha/beta fold hydrolase [Deltaproteobacteria bacterium]|nr:alpha/beta fold hydrolase [Deltaproteobacteria bacterium]
MHYVDEGAPDASPVLFVHGNPTWSFYYRNLIKALSPTHRCVAPDHIGCGKSDKPGDARYGYRFERRVDDLSRLVDSLELEQVSLVAHDWGGMIGMTWAHRHPERVARIALMNTAAFPLPSSKRLPGSLRLTRTPLGSLLVRGFNAFSRGTIRFGAKTKLAPEVRHGLVAPYDSWDNRIAVLRFVQDIPLSPRDPGYALIAEVAAGLERFSETPFLIAWGEKDFVFDRHFLAEWERRMPSATIQRFPEAGHYLLEDEPVAVVKLIGDFVKAAR